MQPRWLVAQLEELDYQSDFQIELISSLLYQAQAMNSLTQEYLGLAKSDVLAVYQLYQSLKEHYATAFEYAQSRLQRVELQMDHAVENVSVGEKSLTDAHQLHDFWRSQVNKAQNWCITARNHLSDCEQQTELMRARVEDAKQDLLDARLALKIAQSKPNVRVYQYTDSQGRDVYREEPPDTSYEERKAYLAIAELEARREKHRAARHQEELAVQELRRAQTQLNGAKNAESDGEKSVTMASYALEVANDSKRQAGYSQESARACLQTLVHVKAELDRFEQTCNQQSSLLSQLDSEANQAFLQVRDLETQHESIQGEVFTLKYTLQDKTSLLIAYDQPLSSR